MTKDVNKTVKVINQGGPFGGVYFVSFIGAAVYFVQQSSGFWEFLWALVQAMVWPGFVVYHALRLLQA